MGVSARTDIRASASLHRLAVESATVADVTRALTFLGNPVVLALLTALTLGCLRSRRPDAWWLLVATVAGSAVETGCKLLIGRTRPDYETVVAVARGNSFPSGHAMNSAFVYGALALVVTAGLSSRGRRLLAFGAVVLVGVIGSTRPVLGVHFVSDVVAGWTLGAVWLVLIPRPPWMQRRHAADPDVQGGLGPQPGG